MSVFSRTILCPAMTLVFLSVNSYNSVFFSFFSSSSSFFFFFLIEWNVVFVSPQELQIVQTHKSKFGK